MNLNSRLQSFVGAIFQFAIEVKKVNIKRNQDIALYGMDIETPSWREILLKEGMMKKIGKLHVLTDTVLQSRFSHTELTRLAIAGGAGAQPEARRPSFPRKRESTNVLAAEAQSTQREPPDARIREGILFLRWTGI